MSSHPTFPTRYADWQFRYRWWIAGVVALGYLCLLPFINILNLENDFAAWFAEDDPHWLTYQENRDEFGGSRNLIIALETDNLFTRPCLGYLRDLTEKLEDIPHVLRVYSLANATRVVVRDDALEVRSYLDDLETADLGALRDLACNDEGLSGFLVSTDATSGAIVVSFHEVKADPIRDELLKEARRLAAEDLPPGLTVHFNGSIEIGQEYDRQSVRNMIIYPPLMFLLMIASVYYLFRSWGRVLVIMITTGMAVGITLALFGVLGFRYNILSTMIIPLITILAIVDDMHLIQAFDQAVAEGKDRATAFRTAIAEQMAPIFGATLTTSLGLASLAVSQVAAVRQFGIASALGVMADMVVSFALVPLMLYRFRVRGRRAPAGERLGRMLSRAAQTMAPRSAKILVVAALLTAFSIVGIFRLKASTNHVAFFPKSSPIRQSAELIDQKLAGVYSFEIILEGAPDTFKDPDLLRRVNAFVAQIKDLPDIRHAVSFLDGLKKIHRALADDPEGDGLPTSVAGVAQSVFLYGMSDAGRFDLRSYLSSDFSRMRIWVKMPSGTSERLFAQIMEVDALANTVLGAWSDSGLHVIVTGVGRLFFALDVYLMQSQLRSFGTAFLTVFAVIFVVLRSIRYGLLSIIPNVVPVVLILGIMGWLGITLNAATVMVASVALGAIDDDTVHFIMRYRREIRLGADTERALATAIETAGGAALLAALINALAFGIMATCPYKPIAFWGWLMSLTMFIAFLSEILLLPAVIRVAGPLIAPADARHGK